MARKNRGIGSAGLEQAGANMGNDYTRTAWEDQTFNVTVPKKKKAAKKMPAKKPAAKRK